MIHNWNGRRICTIRKNRHLRKVLACLLRAGRETLTILFSLSPTNPTIARIETSAIGQYINI